MPTPKLEDTEEGRRTLAAAYEAWRRHGGKRNKAAAELGIPPRTFDNRLERAKLLFEDQERMFHVEHPPEPDETIDELLERKKRKFNRIEKHEDARRLIGVRVTLPGPIGILHFGDPHLDDDACDIGAFEAHTDLVNRTEGLFAANVGDMTNNWIGRLARLYSDQTTTAADGWRLCEHFLGAIKDHLLYLVGGNHDAWSGSGDPLHWITRQHASLYQSSEVRVELRLPSEHKVRINARHDFTGHSQDNPAHSVMKALVRGPRDHIAICGHRHKSGYGVLKCPETLKAIHGVQVASYKIYDRFAREKGFRDQNLSPCVVTTVDTRLEETHPDFIKVWWDPEEGAEYLTWLRQRGAD